MKFSPLSLFAATVCLALAGCATQYKNKQDMLKASGFRAFAATGPTQVVLFKTLPPGKISAVTNHRRTYYVFPDPEVDRIYAGTRGEYRAYEKLRARRKLPADGLADTSLTKTQDWNAWPGLSDGWYTF
jgi:hypothetical protein